MATTYDCDEQFSPHRFTQVNEPIITPLGYTMGGTPTIPRERGVRIFCTKCGVVKELGK